MSCPRDHREVAGVALGPRQGRHRGVSLGAVRAQTGGPSQIKHKTWEVDASSSSSSSSFSFLLPRPPSPPPISLLPLLVSSARSQEATGGPPHENRGGPGRPREAPGNRRGIRRPQETPGGGSHERLPANGVRLRAYICAYKPPNCITERMLKRAVFIYQKGFHPLP